MRSGIALLALTAAAYAAPATEPAAQADVIFSKPEVTNYIPLSTEEGILGFEPEMTGFEMKRVDPKIQQQQQVHGWSHMQQQGTSKRFGFGHSGQQQLGGKFGGSQQQTSADAIIYRNAMPEEEEENGEGVRYKYHPSGYSGQQQLGGKFGGSQQQTSADALVYRVNPLDEYRETVAREVPGGTESMQQQQLNPLSSSQQQQQLTTRRHEVLFRRLAKLRSSPEFVRLRPEERRTIITGIVEREAPELFEVTYRPMGEESELRSDSDAQADWWGGGWRGGGWGWGRGFGGGGCAGGCGW